MLCGIWAAAERYQSPSSSALSHTVLHGCDGVFNDAPVDGDLRKVSHSGRQDDSLDSTLHYLIEADCK
jgi:hypothetical protein